MVSVLFLGVLVDCRSGGDFVDCSSAGYVCFLGCGEDVAGERWGTACCEIGGREGEGCKEGCGEDGEGFEVSRSFLRELQ